MIPVAQSMNGPKQGDCLRACIASILELALKAVPNFQGRNQWHRYARWLIERFGFTLLVLQNHPRSKWFKGQPAGFSIGLTKIRAGRDIAYHAVVCQDGEPIWNPAHTEAQYIRKHHIWVYRVFQALNPAAARKKDER